MLITKNITNRGMLWYVSRQIDIKEQNGRLQSCLRNSSWIYLTNYVENILNINKDGFQKAIEATLKNQESKNRMNHWKFNQERDYRNCRKI